MTTTPAPDLSPVEVATVARFGIHDEEARSKMIAEVTARANAATPGPWRWTGDARRGGIFLAGRQPGVGMVSVVDFRRAGMQGAEPRFIDEGFWMKRARDLAVFEVCRAATSMDDPRLYRHDIVGFRHPDATFIASARTDIEILLAEVARLNGLLSKEGI